MRNYLSREALTEPCLRNLFIAPIVGAMFLMFLPLIGWLLLIHHFAVKAASAFNFAPQAVGNAYLTGHPTPEGTKSDDKKLEALAKEIRKKRSAIK